MPPLIAAAPPPGSEQSEVLQRLLQPPWITIGAVIGGFFALWLLYLTLPLLFRGIRLGLNALFRRADRRTLGWLATVTAVAALVWASIRITFAQAEPELQYYVLTAAQLVVVVTVVLLVVAFITWLTMAAFQLVGQVVMSRRYVLFIGWHFLRSHRQIVHEVRAYEGGRKPRLLALLGGALTLGALAFATTLVSWPRFIGDFDVAVPVFRWTLVAVATVMVTWPLRRLQEPGAIDWFDRTEAWIKNLPNLLTVTASTFISIVGVGVGVWALVVVLSVMGGFETDLRSKILSTNPHVVIQDDAPMEGIPSYHALLGQLEDIEGVTEAIPFVQGDVIITSRENRNVSLTLRGIDPSTIGRSDHHLKGSVVDGTLENLHHPERLVPSARWILKQSPEPEGKDDPAPEPPVEPAPEPTDGPTIVPTPIPGVEARPASEATIQPTPIPGVDDPGAPALDEGIRPGILLGEELANSLRVGVGSEVTVVSPRDDAGFLGIQPRARTFRVAGIFHTGMYEFDLKLAYISLSEAQRFFHMGPDINRIELRLADVDRSDEVLSAIEPLIAGTPSLNAVDWKRLNRNLFSALMLEKIVMFVVLGFIILVASFNVVGSLAMIILEKTQEIAILKSMGATRAEVRRMFLVLGSFIGGIGSVAGLSVGLLTCWFIRYVGIQLPRQYYIDKLPVYVDPVTIATVFLSGIALCLLATIYPALEAGRIKPVEGLRYE